LVALAGGGAFMTVQSVTAHDNTEPAPAASAAVPAAEPLAKQDAAPAIEAEAAAPAVAVAKTEDRAPAETVAAPSAPAAPIRIAAADPEPMPAVEAESRGDLGSLTEAATSSALDAPAAADSSDAPAAADTTAAPAAAPAPQRLASTDPRAAAPEAAPVKQSLGAVGAGPAKINAGVKLRSNPDNGAPVIGLLSAGTGVTVIGCKGWCEVTTGDKRGFVFQRFLTQANAG
jgi:hypothetical protein